MKHCPKCNRDLPESEFSKRSEAKDKLNYQCRQCDRKRQLKRHKKAGYKQCACGCGQYIKKVDQWSKSRDFIQGHNRKSESSSVLYYIRRHKYTTLYDITMCCFMSARDAMRILDDLMDTNKIIKNGKYYRVIA